MPEHGLGPDTSLANERNNQEHGIGGATKTTWRKVATKTTTSWRKVATEPTRRKVGTEKTWRKVATKTTRSKEAAEPT